MHFPELSQTITTAIQLALVDLIDFLALNPSVVVGHSSGEIAAAYCAGFLSHESAMRVSYFRGIVASKLSEETRLPYGMASIGVPASRLSVELEELEGQEPQLFRASQITISCVNGPANITVSGPVAHLDRVIVHFTAKNIFARKLKVNLGYHSPQMKTISSEYLHHLHNLQPRGKACRARMVSTVVPGIVDLDTVCSSEYWVQNMVSPVQFVDAMGICCQHYHDGEVTKSIDRSHLQAISTHGWLEVGPYAALKGPLREIFALHARGDLFYTSMLVRNRAADLTVLDALGSLFCRGFHVDLGKVAQLDAGTARNLRVVADLPKY